MIATEFKEDGWKDDYFADRWENSSLIF